MTDSTKDKEDWEKYLDEKKSRMKKDFKKFWVWSIIIAVFLLLMDKCMSN